MNNKQHLKTGEQFDSYRLAYQQFCYQGVSHQNVAKRDLTARQLKIYNLASVGWRESQIAQRLGITVANVNDGLKKIKFNGWII